NLFARFGNQWVTPPVTDGLLPGIWRAYFLQDTHAHEQSITVEELLAADEVIVGNSVRGGWRVQIVTE
ncbi:MAG: aminotransferase class IV, partial [Thermoleophilia bacterium]|nr:aminotransferase class IV [Thermoleophilia bacterium]